MIKTIISGLFLALTCLCLPFSSSAKPGSDLFGQLPSIYDAAISPDGKKLAYIGSIDGTYVVTAMNLDGSGTPQRAKLGERIKPSVIRWANNEQVLVSIWRSDMLSHVPITSGFIYTMNSQTGKSKILIKPKIFRQYNNRIIDMLADDPDHILMAFPEESNINPPGIHKVNVVTGRYTRERRGLKDTDYWTTDRRGEPRVGQGRNNRSGKWNLRIRDADGDKWRNADDYPGLDADVSISGFTKNPNELIIRDYQGRDTLGFYIYDLSQKAISRKLYHNDTYDADGLVFSNDGSEIIGAKYIADETEIELFEEHNSVLARIRKKYDGFTVDYVDQSADGNLVLFKVSSPSDAGGMFLMNGQTDTLTTIGYFYKDLDSNNLGMVVNVKYYARDKAVIPAYVTLPPGIAESAQIKKLPFIVLPHGGPYARKSKRFDYLAQFFATRGYGVLQMNFRGSEGYGKRFEDAGRENWVVMQEDVEDGAKFLLRKGYADSDRLCIAGWSYGGYAALMGALKNPELYSCAISMAGVTDLQDMIRDMRKYEGGKIAAKDFVLKGFKDKDDIKANSPVKLADALTVPLFLAHGELDQRVHFDQFKRMQRALKKSSAKVTYMEFEDEDHFLSNQKHRQNFFRGLDKFLVEVNGESEFAQ